MTLESIASAGIGQIVIESGFNESSASKKYSQLKSSALFDRQRGLWRKSVRKNVVVLDNEPWPTDIQLLGVITESLFNPHIAELNYRKIKKRFYDHSQQLWVDELYDEGSEWGIYGVTVLELLDVSIKSKFNRQEAEKSFKTLKSRGGFNKETGFWDSYIDGSSNSSYCLTNLIGVLAEAVVENKPIYDRFKSLQQGPFYEAKSNLWSTVFGKFGNSDPTHPNKQTEDQLMAVIVEAHINPVAAREQYQKLKHSPFYNNKDQYWREFVMKDGSVFGDKVKTISQLLGIWCEYLFENDKNSVNPTVPLKRAF